MERDFDVVVDRTNTNSLKHDFVDEFGKPEGVIPLWVADMDFPCPKAVEDKLTQLCQKGIFGYSGIKEGYLEAAENWFARRFGWNASRDWLVMTPGVVFAINMAVRALTEPGDAVLIQQPVYYPFQAAIENNCREMVNSPLVLKDGKYYMDFEDMEEKIVKSQVKLFILCSPHNPVGRVWTEEELHTAGEICRRHGVIVVSDEIHCDFVRRGYRHHMFPLAGDGFDQFSVVCTAPSKTFNLAGLQASNLWIANEEIREKVQREIRCTGYNGLGMMGIAACEAAYRDGETWLEELIDYLEGNLDCIRSYISAHIPQIKVIEPEGTYLVWLDCRGLGLTEGELNCLMIERAGLWMDDGAMFGAGGEGFQRLNIASPRTVLKRALAQLHTAIQGR